MHSTAYDTYIYIYRERERERYCLSFICSSIYTYIGRERERERERGIAYRERERERERLSGAYAAILDASETNRTRPTQPTAKNIGPSDARASKARCLDSVSGMHHVDNMPHM